MVLTLSRFFLALFVVGLVIISQSILLDLVACLIFGLACLTDLLDGYLARRQHHVTSLGKLLDPIADKFLVYSVLAAFAMKGMVAVWVVGLMLAREGIVTLFRMRQQAQGLNVAAGAEGKVKTALQYAALGACLLLLLAGHSGTWSPESEAWGARALSSLMVLCLILTWSSGISYLLEGTRKDLFRLWNLAVSTFGGVGLGRPAPGTLASLATLPFLWWVSETGGLFFFFLGATILGFLYAPRAIRIFGSKDPESFVLDEVCGLTLAVLWVPIHPASLVLAFGLFRFFDIVKPLGIRRLEKRPGASGIMLDDLAAGLYTNLILQVMSFVGWL